jgi:hypothetical protein
LITGSLMVVGGLLLLFYILRFVFGAVLMIAGLVLVLVGKNRTRVERVERH